MALFSSTRSHKAARVLPGFNITLGFTLTYLSLIVLIPLSALVFKTFTLTWPQFWEAVTGPRVMASYKLTFGASLIAALVANHFKREGISFSLLVFTIITAVGSLFAALFPNVLPSSTDPAFSLTIENASSSQYTLTVMSWVAVVMIPLVLLYQGWTYWVFRKRVSRKSIPAGSH